MMNPPVISNSGSLEDCHTNFFTLTDLCGIRWRKIAFIEPVHEPLNDPILRSYARCLRENILCVWRRVASKSSLDAFQTGLYEPRPPNSVTHPPLSLRTAKELWIFWYGDQPDLNELLVPELLRASETSEGCYENGITYECRSLLFKALHNLIERCLLSRGVMRLGKWFVQPCTKQNCSIENGYHHMSFSFGFFVHGESTVCTSIDLRNHPNVRRLTLDHVKEAALNSDFNTHPVILAPYGLAATLTGKYYKPTDPVTKKTLREWSVFYPLLRKTEHHYPPVVEVIADGVKMCYPSKYVLVTDIDDEEFAFGSIPKMYQRDDMNETENENKITTPFGIENIIGERVFQECVVSSQILASTQQPDESNTNESSNDKEPYFEHPTSRTVCNCTIRKNPDEKPDTPGGQQQGQSIADMGTGMPSLGTPSSPELSPYFPYPPSISPPEYESQHAVPIPSPQLSSQYELQNFLNSPSDYDDANSPFVPVADQSQAAPHSRAGEGSSSTAMVLTPNLSPDDILGNPVDQLSPFDLLTKDSKMSDDESKDKLLKTDILAKTFNISTAEAIPIDRSIPNTLDISIKTEHLTSDIDDIDTNQLNDSSYLDNELDNIFGESVNESETKMSYESEHNKKSDRISGNSKSNMNDSSDSSDDESDDSDSDDDSDDDGSSTGSENVEGDDDGSDVEQKRSADSKLKKKSSSGDVARSSKSKDCDNNIKASSENIVKILTGDISPTFPDLAKNAAVDSNRRNRDKLGCTNIDNSESSGNSTNKDGSVGAGRGDKASLNDLHSNISDSSIGDFCDDDLNLDDSSNDSGKSGKAIAKTEAKSSTEDLPYSSSLLEDLNTTDSSDSNFSERQLKVSQTINMLRPNLLDVPQPTKLSPNTKAKGTGSVGMSMDSAIGSKSMDDDNAMSDLHMDNISDDEYDDVNAEMAMRRGGNLSLKSMRTNASFDNLVSSMPNSLNAIISGDYSSLSDNNDTSSNEHNRDLADSKRTDRSPNRTKDDKDMTDSGRLLVKKMLDSQNSSSTSSSSKSSSSKQSHSSHKSSSRSDKKESSSSHQRKSDKMSFKSLHDSKGGSSSGSSSSKQKHKTDELESFSFNFLDDHSMEDSNQSSILDNIMIDPSRDKTIDMSVHVSRGMERESLSQIMDSIKPSGVDDEFGHMSRSGFFKNLKMSNRSPVRQNYSGSHSSHRSEKRSSDEKRDKKSHDSRSSSVKAAPRGKELPSSMKLAKRSSFETDAKGEHLGDFEYSAKMHESSKASSDKRSSSSKGGSNNSGGHDGSKKSSESSSSKSKKGSEETGTSKSSSSSSNRSSKSSKKSKHSKEESSSKKSSKSSHKSEKSTSKSSSGDSKSEHSSRSTETTPSKRSKESSSGHGKSSSGGGGSDNRSKDSKNSDNNKSSSNNNSSNSNIANNASTSGSNNSYDNKKSGNSSTSGGNNSKNNNSGSSGGAGNSASSANNNVAGPNTATNTNNNSATSSTADGGRTAGGNNPKRIAKSLKRSHRSSYNYTLQTLKRSAMHPNDILSLLKTPALNMRGQELIDAAAFPHMLYDFTTWEAWMNHPVKLFRDGGRFPTRAIFRELQEVYARQNTRQADFKSPPNSVESKSLSDISDDDGDQDYFNDSESNSNLSECEANSPDVLCGPTHITDIYFDGSRSARNPDQDGSENSNEGFQVPDRPYSGRSPSKLFMASKYAPLANVSPSRIYSQTTCIYRPSWDNKKAKGGIHFVGRYGVSAKNKSRNKHKSGSAAKGDAGKAKPSAKGDVPMDVAGAMYAIKKELPLAASHMGGHLQIKQEPIDDYDGRNDSDSDTDSETNKKARKSRDGANASRKRDKSHIAAYDSKVNKRSPYGNSDENSNDSSRAKDDPSKRLAMMERCIKSEPNAGSAGNNLDKSCSSVEEFDNDKKTRTIIININLEYESEIYNDEVNMRRFHKNQRNTETGTTTIHVYESATGNFPLAPVSTDSLPQNMAGGYSSSDTDSDDSDANDLDSDGSSCDECANGPCSPAILPSLHCYETSLPSPATSITSYYNKNLNYLEAIAQSNQRIPEANSLILNLMLYDTSLNVFRDHNFDSCSLCVCHPAADGSFGNIRGSESGRLVPLNGSTFVQSIPTESMLNINPYGQFETESDRLKRLRNAYMVGYLDTDPVHCSCGYSATVNRRLSHKTGLFYDDEMEITGMAEDPQERKLHEKQYLMLQSERSEDFVSGVEKIVGSVSQVIMDYIQDQCTCVQSCSTSIRRSIRFANDPDYYAMEDTFMNMVELADAHDIITLAINNSKHETNVKARKNLPISRPDPNAPCTNVHKWPYIKACVPANNKDVLKFMQMLLPVLQGSFNKKYMRRMWEAPYAIQGPLTWRQFHRLASTHSGQCEPQPIPSIIVGHEKEWLSVSPFAIQYWDQLMLEPYSYTRDVAYIVVAPDNDFIVDEAKQFFKELSTMYETCRLGRHCPIKGCDGVLRSGKNTADVIHDEFEELYALFEDNKTIEIIRSYVHTCQQHLVPYLTNIASDKSILDPEPEGFNIKDFSYRDKSMSSPMFQPDTPEFSYGGGDGDKPASTSFEAECEASPSYGNAQTPSAASASNEPIVLTNQSEDEIPPCIIIYVLNPLSFGHESEELQRLSCIALLRSYSKILSALPENIRHNIKLQIISMESILEMGQNCDLLRASDEIRCLALSIFSQCRRSLAHDVTAKVLTGFGTAANLQMVLKNKDASNRAAYRLYAPPYILSGREETIESPEVFGACTVDTPSSVLYCNYCLSQDQRWLLAVATDERGELLETVTINIEVANADPNMNNRGESVRRQSLQKLMDFVIGIISQTSNQWRIVIGRIGRMGHGELKAWSWLLCKSSLVKVSKQMKDVCDQCSMMYLHSCPSIVSACLLTLEPDTSFRILSDQFTPDERFSQIAMQSTLSTPSDLSCTHILVLPITASAQAVQSYPEHHITDFSEEIFAQGMAGINGLNNINNMSSMNFNNMGSMNNMNSLNGMNINGMSGLNNANSMNMNAANLQNLNGMSGISDLGGLTNINGLGDVNSINGVNLNNLNGIDGMDGIEGIDPIDGMDQIDALDGMDDMEGMEVNMNNIEDFFGNDWENEIQLPPDNPQDDPSLETRLDAGPNPVDVMHALAESKMDHTRDMKQDHDQKPNSNLMISMNMGKLSHQVKLEADCDTGNMRMQLHTTSDEFGQMQQQPLAIGFMVSTAPINRMPSWFWANCPQLENVNPVFLKSSLHIHSPMIHQNSPDYINQRFSRTGLHPLDSPYTADTMRYILESYNFLSWLAIDPNTNDRISCLPAHIQVLIQLYNMIAAFT